MYSDSFGVSLIAMSMITSLVIIAVTSNVVLSLVGGLSYQLSIDSVEKDVILQVTRVIEKLSKMQRDVFELVEEKRI